MIVYVETNFVLEVAFRQEEYESCDAIMVLAEAGAIELAMPAFSIAESCVALRSRSRQRTSLLERLNQEIRELSRSAPYAQISESWTVLSSVLISSNDAEKQHLNASLIRILECVETISSGAETIRAAIEFHSSLGLLTQDSIVHASVVGHLSVGHPEPKCFLNKNSQDFAKPGIREQLRGYNCRLITSFTDGLGYIRSELS